MTEKQPVETQRTFEFYEVLPRGRALTAGDRASKKRSASTRVADTPLQIAKPTKVDAPIDVSAVRKETRVHAFAEQSSTRVAAGLEIATWEVGRFAFLRVWLNGHHISQRKVMTVVAMVLLTGAGIAAYGGQAPGIVEMMRQWFVPQTEPLPKTPSSAPVDAQPPSPLPDAPPSTPSTRTKFKCLDIDNWLKNTLGIDTCNG